MVCIYCWQSTDVINSRHQKRINQVWRRRRCKSCQAVFTTQERINTQKAIQVAFQGHVEPFSRDKLLLSVFDSLRHRKTATTDATYLLDTILSKIYPQIKDATIHTKQIVEIVIEVLNNFDKVAAIQFRAFHPD